MSKINGEVVTYDKHNYRIYYADKKIIAVSTYAQKPVRGVAICSDDDEFDVDLGIQLAVLRCNAKICAKRHANAQERMAYSKHYLDRVKKLVEKYEKEYETSTDELLYAEAKVEELKAMM